MPSPEKRAPSPLGMTPCSEPAALPVLMREPSDVKLMASIVDAALQKPIQDMLTSIDLRIDRQHALVDALLHRLTAAGNVTPGGTCKDNAFEHVLCQDGSLDECVTAVPTQRSDGTPKKRGTSGFGKSNSYLEALSQSEEGSIRTPSKELSMRLSQAAKNSIFKRLASSWKFEAIFGIMIVLNAVLIGAQVELAAVNLNGEMPDVLETFSSCFAFIFLVELLIRMVAEGRTFFTSTLWNVFDFVLVAVSLFEVFLSAVITSASQDTVSRSSNLRIFRIIRITRLAKFVRIVRIMRFVRALRTLVFSIMMTMRSLLWSLLLMGFILFVFAVVFTDIVTNHLSVHPGPWDDSSPEALLKFHFGSLLRSGLTLYACVLNGMSWSAVADALGEVSWITLVLFISYISFICLAVLNVVTGVFCQSAIESAHQDHEMMVQGVSQDKEFYLHGLQTLFNAIDEDGSGAVSIREFEHHFNDPAVKHLFAALGLAPSDAWSLFVALDVDGDNKVSAREFLDGCLNLRGSASAIGLANIRRDLEKLAFMLPSAP
eukprot:TRINITY_DN39731_c0_g1_i1.p1 TRINITY_DN39731_c0_g1~~TRINITY_DN39731_c0_g1_i1.p1  ORF type:complete len:544 (-),score=67.08 TRINITY_DN39731_c0_g1_i1:234-1865(-)